jgi:glycerophosphoryl diester phosphodiesterase
LHVEGHQENTLAAISSAFDQGADQVEFDVHQTLDGVWVLHHDQTFYDQKYRINRLRYDQLVEISEHLGEELDTLDRVLDRHPENWLNIECKSDTIQAGEDLIQLIEDHNRFDHFHISSFNKSALVGIRNHSANARISLLGIFLILPAWQAFHKRYRLYSINPFHTFIYPFRVHGAHKRKLQIQAWTVNSKNSIERLINSEIDVIITDNLQLALNIRSALAKEKSE